MIRVAALLAVVAFSASAAETPPPDAVVVGAKRTKIGAVAYAKFYKAAKILAEATQGRAALALRMSPARKGVDLQDLSVTLSDDQEDIPLSLREHRLMAIPVVERMVERGEFIVNKPSGAVDARLIGVSNVAPSAWTVGLVRTVIRDVDSAMPALKSQMPWYMRFFVSGIHAVAFCSPTRGETITLAEQGRVIASFVADQKERDDFDRQVYCHAFSADVNYPDSARIKIDGAAEVIFL